jgi:hypothetical protein
MTQWRCRPAGPRSQELCRTEPGVPDASGRLVSHSDPGPATLLAAATQSDALHEVHPALPEVLPDGLTRREAEILANRVHPWWVMS